MRTLVLVVLAGAVALTWGVTTMSKVFSEASRVRQQALVEVIAGADARCERLCKDHEGMSHRTSSVVSVMANGTERFCVCWDGTEIRMP